MEDFQLLPLYQQSPDRKLLPSPSSEALAFEQMRIVKSSIFRGSLLSWLPMFFLLGLYAIFSFSYAPKFISSLRSSNLPGNSDKSISVELSTPTPTSIPPTPTPDSLVPSRLIISKLKIDTEVEHVGQTKSFNMDVPKNAAHVAWYVYGAKPGEGGNAVINGHFDTPSGAPAIFYHLNDLAIGDEVKTISEDGIEKIFVVTGKETHPYATFPNEFVFHSRPGTNLNLITCAGIWDTKNKIYNNRLVIYTSLKT